jgi:hypothetical protein
MIVLIIVAAMASSNHSAQTAIHGSVATVLQLVTVELQQLLVRRDEVTKRIRSLHTAVNALEEFAAHTRSSTAAIPLGTMKEKPSLPEMSTPNSTESMNDASPRLRRACRIALLETDKPLSEQEIYARIIRRGSFSFVNADSAFPAILRELTGMAEVGEVRCFPSGSGSNKTWQQMSREPDSSASESSSKAHPSLPPTAGFSAQSGLMGRIDSR